MNHNWTPCISLGPIRFGEKIGTVLTEFEFSPREYATDATGWSTFASLNGDTLVHLENEVVQSVTCYQQCLLNGSNLIGLSLKPLLKASQLNSVERSDQLLVAEELQDVYEFDMLGAQVWLHRGRIVTIICDAP